MIKFYRDLWKERAHLLAPIMEMTKKKKKGPIAWTEEAKMAFEAVKKVCAKNTMLHYPDYISNVSKIFPISDQFPKMYTQQLYVQWNDKS